MKNQIRPQFPTPRSIGYGAGYLIDEPADHRTVPLPGHGCHRKYLPGVSRSIFREYFRHPWNIAAAPCRDSDVAVLLAVNIDHGSREKRADTNASERMW
jgi:hypothetical protein